MFLPLKISCVYQNVHTVNHFNQKRHQIHEEGTSENEHVEQWQEKGNPKYASCECYIKTPLP